MGSAILWAEWFSLLIAILFASEWNNRKACHWKYLRQTDSDEVIFSEMALILLPKAEKALHCSIRSRLH